MYKTKVMKLWAETWKKYRWNENLEWFPVIRLHSVVLYHQYEWHWDRKGQTAEKTQNERIASLKFELNASLNLETLEGNWVNWTAIDSVLTCSERVGEDKHYILHKL